MSTCFRKEKLTEHLLGCQVDIARDTLKGKGGQNESLPRWSSAALRKNGLEGVVAIPKQNRGQQRQRMNHDNLLGKDE